MANINIAIDGPAGTGKTSTGKLLARKLKYSFIDTGLMYRALTYYGVKKKINFNNANEIIMLLEDVSFTYDILGDIILNGENIMNNLNDDEIIKNINKVTVIGEVRQSLVQRQRDIVADGGFVVVGRDIGTVVLPDAQLKIYLTATTEKRVQRRAEQLSINPSDKIALEKLKKQIDSRDQNDIKRDIGALKPAKDAVKLDNTNLTLKETMELILDMFQAIIK